MNVPYRTVLFLAVFLAALILFWQSDFDPAPESDIHLGIWTCESGPPGNRLHFWYVETEALTPLVRALNGHAKVENLFGQEASEGVWNFGYWEPLIVNLSLGDTHAYLAVKKVDDDHLLVRSSTDCNALLDAPFDDPEVLLFRRVRDRAE